MSLPPTPTPTPRVVSEKLYTRQDTTARPSSFASPLQSYIPDSKADQHHMITFSEIVEELKSKYNFEESVTSTSLDILALYLKGQKILHMESKTLCEKRLNSLMLPAIIISSVCAILNFAVQGTSYGAILVSCMNVVNSFLMALVSYLKLDAKAQAHQSSAYKYQKLEATCEFHSGRILFFKDVKSNQDIATIVDDIQNRVLEIKESNQFIIPESIRHRFNDIFSTNVFTLVKDIQNDEIILINKLKVIVQKMQYIRRRRHTSKTRLQEIIERIAFLENHIESLNLIKLDENEKDEKGENENVKENEKGENENENENVKDNLYTIKQTVLTELQELIKEKRECTKAIEDFTLEKEKMEKEKVEALEDAISFRKTYLALSSNFDEEMLNDRLEQGKYYDLCNWCKT